MIKEMTFDERSYILALISDSAYLAPKKASSIFKKIGFVPSENKCRGIALRFAFIIGAKQ